MAHWRTSLCLLFIYILLPFSVAAGGGGEEELEETSQQEPSSVEESPDLGFIDTEVPELNGLVQTLNAIILSNPNDDQVKMVYANVLPAIQSGLISILYDDDPIDLAIYSSNFSVFSDSGEPFIVVNKEILENIEANPSFSLSLLFQSYVHANNYLELAGDYLNAYGNPVDFYLYTMDSIYLQMLFSRDYLKPVYGQLSDYEEYLISTYEVDSLASYSMFFLGIDQNLIYSLIELSNDAEFNDLPFEEFISVVLSGAENIQANLEKSLSDWNQLNHAEDSSSDIALYSRMRYISLISAGTFLKYGVLVINRAIEQVYNSESNETIDEALEQINRLSERSYNLFVNGQDFLRIYRQDFIADFSFEPDEF